MCHSQRIGYDAFQGTSGLLEDSFSAVITGQASQKALMTKIELRPFVNVHASPRTGINQVRLPPFCFSFLNELRLR
jgi:hypothetical protein